MKRNYFIPWIGKCTSVLILLLLFVKCIGDNHEENPHLLTNSDLVEEAELWYNATSVTIFNARKIELVDWDPSWKDAFVDVH